MEHICFNAKAAQIQENFLMFISIETLNFLYHFNLY